jgi:hypothetical protein
MQMLYACYKAGENNMAEKLSKLLQKDMEQQASYYRSLPDNKRESLSQEIDRNDNMLKGISELKEQFKMMNQQIESQKLQNVAPTDTAKP